MEFNKSEYNALIHLLDDDDSEVVEHVFDKIEEVGEVGIPILENYLQSGNHLLQKRILKLLNKFEWVKVYNELQLWHDQEEKELLKAVFLISKVFDPKLEENTIVQQIERISQRIWLRVYQNQSAFEQIQVFNYVIFSERAFENQGNVYGAYQFSLVDKVLSSKKGNSLGIGLIYLLIAESLELPIYGIVLPSYFALTFTKYWHSQKSMENQDVINDIIFYVNLAENGQTFSKLEIDQYLFNNKISVKQSFYQPCSNKVIIQLLIHQLLGDLDPIENANEYEQLKKMAQIFE